MKKRLYITTALSISSLALLLSSCLKDSKYYVDFTKTTPLVELPGAANVSGTAGYFEVVGVTAADGPSPFNVPVNLAAPNPLGNSIKVTFKEDQAAFDTYNAANGGVYTIMPADAFNSSGLSVTIPAGQNLVNLVVEVTTTALDPTLSYVLPLTISDASGIQISNYKTILFNVTVKNAYDGLYTESGYKFHPTATVSHPLSGTFPVSTVTATTSNTALGDLGGSGYSFNFDVDASNKLVNWVAEGAAPPAPASGFYTLDNPEGVTYPTTDGTAPGTAPYVQTTYNNTYDPATKTFWMHYGYGVGSSDQTGWTRNFYVKLVAQ